MKRLWQMTSLIGLGSNCVEEIVMNEENYELDLYLEITHRHSSESEMTYYQLS